MCMVVKELGARLVIKIFVGDQKNRKKITRCSLVRSRYPGGGGGGGGGEGYFGVKG